MRDSEVVKCFLSHIKADSIHLHATPTKLFSYYTCIAEFINDELVGNNTKYSTTSSIHLSYIRPYVDIWTTTSVPIGTTSLKDFVN